MIRAWWSELWSDRPILMTLIALAIAFVAYGIYEIRQQTVRFRLTIEIDTPEGVKTGSSVIEARLPASMGRGLNPVAYAGTHRGLAPIVDLGEKGIVIVSLTGGRLPEASSYKDFALAAWELPLAAWSISRDPVNLSPVRGSGPVQLTSIRQPMLIWLENPNSDAPLVSQALLPRQMPWMLGSGYAVRTIMLEPTSDALLEKTPNPPKWLAAIRPLPRVRTGQPNAPITLRREMLETAPVADAPEGERE